MTRITCDDLALTRVVNVDGGNEELALLEELVKVVDTGCGLLRNTLAVCQESRNASISSSVYVNARRSLKLGTNP